MIVWINGAFGSGKTSTAAALRRYRPELLLYDPETVGYVMRHHLEDQWSRVGDFQHWQSWRRLVVSFADALVEESNQDLLAVQSITDEDIWTDIRAGLSDAGHDVVHVLLDPSPDALRRRIEASDEARPWRLAHMTAYAEARSWLLDVADLRIDTSEIDADAAAAVVADNLGGISRGQRA